MSQNRTWNSNGPRCSTQTSQPTPSSWTSINNRIFRQIVESFRAPPLPTIHMPPHCIAPFNRMMHDLPGARAPLFPLMPPICPNATQPLLPANPIFSAQNRQRIVPSKSVLVQFCSPPKKISRNCAEQRTDSTSMRSSEQPSSSQTSVPLVLPKATMGTAEESSSINIFRMILDENHRTRQEQPVVDLEAEVQRGVAKAATESPAPKKRREAPQETDDCVIVDDSEIKPSPSTPNKNSKAAKPGKEKQRGARRASKLPWNHLEATFHVPEQGVVLDESENSPSPSTTAKDFIFAKPGKEKQRGAKRTSKLPWNPLEATFHIPKAVRSESPSPPSCMDKVIDLTVEEDATSTKVATLRDVLDDLCTSPTPPEEGEIVESSDDADTGESCVIDLTCEEELQLTLRSQEEGDVIDLTVANVAEVSDSGSEIVCMEDLTVVDEEEITIIQCDDVTKSQKKSKKRKSMRSSICAGIGRKPAIEDALSKSTKELTGVTPRYWEKFTGAPQPSSSNVEFRVCSYNVLCQLTTLKTMYLYRHLRQDDSPLKWENRWPILEQELLRLNADVYGLQEVQYDHFDSHFRATMSKGYAAYYKQRTGGMNDGCAVLVRKSKFDIVSYRIVEYFVAAGTTMDRDQIGQILRLKCKKTGQELIYANTHLIFNSSRGDIKLGQLAMLFANIQDVLKPSACPVIISGDFNIEPLSYVYTYISESSVYLRGLPRNELSGQGERGGPCVQADNILPSAANVGRDSMFIDLKAPRTVAADYFTHPLRLASVYHHFRDDGKKEVSTYHKEVANPDFIFYTVKEKKMLDSVLQVYELPELRLLRRLGLPDHETLRNTLGPWPNQYVPSDHIPLVADFVLTKSKQK